MTTSRIICALLLTCSVAAQQPGPADETAQRISERMQALQREADRLAREARTLLGDVRKLEIERELRAEDARQADAAVADAQRELAATTARLTQLEQQRIDQLPDVKAQLVEMYKRGRAGYAQLLFGASDVREFARAARAVSALTALNQRRLAEHQKTLDALRTERASLESRTRDLQTRQATARRAREAADRAVASHNALIAEIDTRRDLTAQYVGELQQAYEGVQRRIADLGAGRSGAPPVAIPLAPFRGALKWPVGGRITGAFGQPANRLGAAGVRNGIEISAPEGSPVRAIHAGTVGFADAFTGFGNLVILDHGGNNFSLYGYLGSVSVARGDPVDEGAELGRVGATPAALYFEMRIDGRSTDPVQWLEPR